MLVIFSPSVSLYKVSQFKGHRNDVEECPSCLKSYTAARPVFLGNGSLLSKLFLDITRNSPLLEEIK